MGVYWCKAKGKWRAFIVSNKKKIHIGYYDDKRAAADARKQAEFDYRFHPNHGRTTASTSRT